MSDKTSKVPRLLRCPQCIDFLVGAKDYQSIEKEGYYCKSCLTFFTKEYVEQYWIAFNHGAEFVRKNMEIECSYNRWAKNQVGCDKEEHF